MTDLERGPSNNGALSMHESSLNNPSVNSIVESHYAGLEALLSAVHADDPKREILVRIGDAMREAKLAATIISELRAELWRTKNDLANANDNYHEVSTRLADELDVANTNHRAMAKQMAGLCERALAAESSLSRIKSETIDLAIQCVENERLIDHTGQPDDSATNAALEHCIDAIRSLGSTGGGGSEAAPLARRDHDE